MSKLIRAAAYPRYSSDNQREESIHAQMRAIEAYCLQKGYALVATYPDEEKSAKNADRPSFQRMIADAKRKMFDVVVVHKLDRFARNRYDSINYKRLLRQNGVRLESVLERLDDSPESVVMESMFEGIAEYFSLNLAREVRKGMMENARSAKHTGGTPPYGLKVNPQTLQLEIDENTCKAVQMYYDCIEQFVPNEEIANRLNSAGFRTPTGKEFTRTSFATWARNRKYCGDYVYDVAMPRDEQGKRNNAKKKPIEDHTVVEDAIPAIISREQWQRVNAILDARKHKPGRMKAMNYLLSGKIVCGNCGAPYAANSYENKNKARQYYYRCSKKCGNAQIRKDDAEMLAIEYLNRDVFNEETIVEIIKEVQRLYQERRKEYIEDIEPIKKELAEINKQISNLGDAIAAGVMSVIDKLKAAEQRKAVLDYALLQARAAKSVELPDEHKIRELINIKKDSLASADDDVRKEVLQEYVEQMVIDKESKVDDIKVAITYRVLKSAAKRT